MHIRVNLLNFSQTDLNKIDADKDDNDHKDLAGMCTSFETDDRVALLI